MRLGPATGQEVPPLLPSPPLPLRMPPPLLLSPLPPRLLPSAKLSSPSSSEPSVSPELVSSPLLLWQPQELPMLSIMLPPQGAAVSSEALRPAWLRKPLVCGVACCSASCCGTTNMSSFTAADVLCCTATQQRTAHGHEDSGASAAAEVMLQWV